MQVILHGNVWLLPMYMYHNIEFRKHIPGIDSMAVNLLFKGDVGKI